MLPDAGLRVVKMNVQSKRDTQDRPVPRFIRSAAKTYIESSRYVISTEHLVSGPFFESVFSKR
jgi:hypothetical protein